ncbi:MAG: diphosphomevalonate decarboxylase [Halobacteriovoraceae bacterium]|nr:diphosphomevalonate decarboxylase [Halobacteriovoraceae bacterium]
MNLSNRTNDSTQSASGRVIWSAPSNIALVKYWGKKENQIPCNPSISFSLDSSRTEMDVTWNYQCHQNNPVVNFKFEGEENKNFALKISNYIEALTDDYSSLKGLSLDISSKNTFPHSAGIASSASSMAALGLCLSSILKQLGHTGSLQEASSLARLGSGSACRSLYEGWTLWGETEALKESSNEYATPLKGLIPIHPNFENIQDSVLVVTSKPKPVSSRVGHALMHNHPYAEARFKRAVENTSALFEALTEGSWEKFGSIVEAEALDLHAMMLTSDPSYILLRPESLAIIEKVRKVREERGLCVYFTLDAGPNVHLIYPEKSANAVKEWINSELLNLLEAGLWLDDKIGLGPVNKLESLDE